MVRRVKRLGEFTEIRSDERSAVYRESDGRDDPWMNLLVAVLRHAERNPSEEEGAASPSREQDELSPPLLPAEPRIDWGRLPQPPAARRPGSPDARLDGESENGP